MLGAKYLINDVVSQYPPELHDRLQQDIQELLKRERQYLLGQIQRLFSQRSTTDFDDLRSAIDELLLDPDDGTLQNLRSHQAETPESEA